MIEIISKRYLNVHDLISHTNATYPYIVIHLYQHYLKLKLKHRQNMFISSGIQVHIIHKRLFPI